MRLYEQDAKVTGNDKDIHSEELKQQLNYMLLQRHLIFFQFTFTEVLTEKQKTPH